jgi:hypothetical protein
MMTEGQALDRMTSAANALLASPPMLPEDRAQLWAMLERGQAAMHREDYVGATLWAGGVLQVVKGLADH